MLISLDGVSLWFGDRPILKDVTLTVSKGDRIGLVGSNGTGKSTLLNCIAGELTPDEGDIFISRGTRIGYLMQNSGLDREGTVMSEMESVFADVFLLRDRMAVLEEMMSVLKGKGFDAAAEEYSKLSDEFDAADGFSIPVKIRTVLTGMGFSGVDDHPVSTLSGGEKTRLALARLLLENPDVLLLDEPTNHLDFKTLMWLEDYLEDYGGALITVSHDRYFLDKRCSRIWELEDCRVTAFRGNYSAYKLQKAERLKAALKEYEKETVRIVSMKEYAERNIVRASTSNMAKSRLHQLEHIDLPEKPRVHTPAPRFSFSSSTVPVKDVLDIKSLDVTVGEPPLTLVSGIDLHVLRGERVAVIGSNGTGKTTLMRRIFKSYKEGDPNINWGRNTSVSFFEQENDSFVLSNTVMEELWRHRPGASPQEMRDRLGAMLFSGEDVFKEVSVLSGGEKARLAFAILTEEKANVLLLDEPTNHLDLPAREALEKASSEFDGTLIFVSHDRYFINSLATRILELTPEKARLFDGNFDGYLAAVKAEEEQAKQVTTVKSAGEGAAVYHRSKQQRAEEAKKKKRISQLEELIARCEAEIGKANAELADPAVAADFEEVDRLCRLIEETQSLCDGYMEEWADLAE